MPRKSKGSSSTASSSSKKRKTKSTSSESSTSNSQNQSHLSRTTTNHDEIRKWAEARGGVPAAVASTASGDNVGIIRIEFPGSPNNREDSLEEITWDEFFEKFDDSNLELVYQEKTASGQKSNFNKLVRREKSRSASAGR